jgi:hypothetical protein
VSIYFSEKGIGSGFDPGSLHRAVPIAVFPDSIIVRFSSAKPTENLLDNNLSVVNVGAMSTLSQ